MSAIEPSKTHSKTVAYEVTTSPSTSHSSRESEWASQTEEASLDKVRDILFGAQSREFEKRFSLLETRLLDESRALRQELIRSFDDLKAHMNQEVQGLVGQLHQEQGQRATNIQEVGQAVKTVESQLSQRVAELAQQASTQFQTLGSDLHAQKAELMEQHQQAINRIEDQHREAVKELQSEKTDRAVLAEMLMEVALRLKVGPKDSESS
ncbi:MAG: hypothetical protein AB7P17_08480 [Nitrospirales bacterium]|nr:hypothetical protein [Nitrospirales bacterium]